MLNEITLGQILNRDLPPLTINDIEWKTQDSTSGTLLFYRLTDDEKALNKFTERIQNTQFSWLILNKDHPSRPLNSSTIPEKDWPEIQKKILDILYPLPPLKMLALTGTNGKTTTTDLVLQLGAICGKKGLSIGTLGVREPDRTILDFGLTSPSLIDLRKFLNRYGQDKDFCVLEASSHALIQQRLYGLKFDMAGWLSFSQDHLDYHQTMEDYFGAKLLLAEQLKASARMFVPTNETHLYEKLKNATKLVSKAPVLEMALPVFFSTRFNRNNLEVAVAIIEKTFNIKVPNVFDKIKTPDGRFYIRPYGSSYLVVDFAHTPDALENICKGIKDAFPGYALKVLFGCGGDRDRTKRPLMGKVADTCADYIYLTSDNPRSEDPAQIILDIQNGITTTKLKVIVDRPEAVKLAFAELNDHEILLLAGKGHEDYILKNGVKHPYSDIREVEKFLEGKRS